MGSVPMSSDGARELNCEILDEPVDLRGGVVREGQSLLKENESRKNGVSENMSHGLNGTMPVEAALQIQSQKSHGSVVRWEKILPRKSLKVLLVENDDSTRHVVCALLRNCGYEVAAASNGLQAWNILVDLSNGIDLVLTEVDMPYLSGIGLLRKVMSHKIRKNIPVIMMSSHDPMVLVLKCLSKGAVDFLVKPIRKNELKILWQHVWRRSHIPSDGESGSESGVHNKKSAKLKNYEESVSNCGTENGCFDLNIRDGSDNVSGTQSSWTKRPMEFDNPPSVSPFNEQIDPPDSTCAQVIHSSSEASGNNCVATMAMEGLEEDGRFHGTKQDKVITSEPKKEYGQLKKDLLELLSEDPTVSESKHKAVSDSNGHTSLGLNVKRMRVIEGRAGSIHEDRNVLRRSNLSREKAGGCTPTGINSGTARTESTYKISSISNGTPTQQLNGSGNNNDVGFVTENILTGSTSFNEKSTTTNKVDILLEQPKRANQQVQVQHHHHHHHYYHHSVHEVQEGQSHPYNDDKPFAATAIQCGSSNMFNKPFGGSVGKYSSNVSGSGSKHGSNGHNGNNTIENAGEMDIKSENKVAAKGGDTVGCGSENKREVDTVHCTGESGLNKFMQKRKDKCFTNKVANKGGRS